MPSPLDPLPLVHEGDSYVLYLEQVSEKTIRLASIVRYENNINQEACDVGFFDLDERTRAAIVTQFQRRHGGRTLKI